MHFTLKIDDEFSRIWFIRKKHYIGFNKYGGLVIKGLPIIKHGCSKLGRMVFEELQPLMMERKDIKFTKSFVEEVVARLLKKDLSLVGCEYVVKSPSSYKNTHSIQAQIALVLGEGVHFLIPNNKVGCVGKSKKYATIEEAKDLSLACLCLDKTWNELAPFIREE